MKAIAAAVVAASMTLAVPAFADGVKEGWGFQFRQDTFDKTLFPLGIMSEETKDYDKASLFVACAKDGSLVMAYSPSRMISFDQTAKVEFRADAGTKEFTFAALDIPHMGKFLALKKSDSAALTDIFGKASGADVPFRSASKQGVFTSTGAAETFKIVQAHCPGAK